MAQSTSTREPILASWKVSEVLHRYPQLLETLIGLSPKFGLLRNPVLRRVQTRLVTVAQAAQMAGLEPGAVVQALNAAAGLAVPADVAASTPAGAGEADAPPWLASAPVAVELDVRAFHARGEEPFGAIMAAVAKVPVGQVFRLRNTFEPLPLYGVLGKRGFAHRARQLGPDDWEISFFNQGPAGEGGAARGIDLPTLQVASKRPESQGETGREPIPAAAPDAWESPTATVTIDVSDLVPPEPMVRILEAMEQLGPNQTLLVHHVRRPIYLYPRLDELGYLHETRDLGPGRVEILIRKAATE